jgi:energy-coupling factor transporter ATP-binding protein EcfA2
MEDLITNSPVSWQPTLSLGEFLHLLMQALVVHGVRPCVLRNYEGFPTENLGGDIDFLIRPSELPEAIRAVQSIENTQIVGDTEHPHVTSLFLAGISVSPGRDFLQVDFYSNLGLRGLPYLSVDEVLQAAITRRAGDLNFDVPCQAHEGIISLFTSLIVSGRVKEKYFPKVQRAFASGRLEVIVALSPQFGSRTSARLVDSVIDGDRRTIMDCVGPLRRSLGLRCFLRRPFQSIAAVARFYRMEFVARYLPRNLETVCIIGREGSGKTSLIQSLIPILQWSANTVEKRDVNPPAIAGRALQQIAEGAGYRDGSHSGWFASIAKVVRLQLTIWLSQIIREMNLLLRLCEGCYQDLLIDPQGYGYNGPMWFAQLIGKLLPQHDLWILLEAPVEAMQTSHQQPESGKILRQLEAYRAFVKTRRKYVILDSSQPADRVVGGAYAAIIDALAQRTARRLRSFL